MIISECQVSAVVPVFGRDDALAVIPRLLEWHAGVRIVVVDNGNLAERSARIAALAGDRVAIVRLERNRGGSGGYIAGMKYVLEHHDDCELVWLLDDDAVPNEGTLPGMVRAYEQLVAGGEKVACVGSAIVRKDSPEVISECGAMYLAHPGVPWIMLNMRGELLSDHRDEIVKVEYCSACSCVVPMAALRKVGPWKDVFIHYDDVEWGMRAEHRCGYKNFATTMSVVEHPLVNSVGRSWLNYFDRRNKLWLDSKYSKKTFLKDFYWLVRHAVSAILRGNNRGGAYFDRLVLFDLIFRRYRTRDDIVRLFAQHGVGDD